MRRAAHLAGAVALVALAGLVAAPRTPARAAEPPASPCGDVPLAPFVDVDRASSHAPAIDCALWLAIVAGTEPDVFRPTLDVRRDQMAALVARAVVATGRELPAPARGSFRDVEGNVHRDAIEALAAADIVGGYDDGTYRPRASVPRGQMTAFVSRARAYVTGEDPGDAPDAFTDDDGHVHEPTIDELAARGIVTGRTATTFAPDEPTTRAETATFLVRSVGDVGVGPGVATSTAFRSSVSALPPALRERMTGVSWRPGCPVELDALRLVTLVHRGLDGRDRWGLLVLRDSVAGGVARAFGEAYAGDFRIERMRIVDRYGADDDASMADNNTSAFNCRYVSGTTRWSRHSYGDAVDVNPVQNPWVRGDEVEPPAGRDYLDRSDVRPGMVVRPSALLAAFEELGWGWGGDWSTSKDYQHLSSTGT